MLILICLAVGLVVGTAIAVAAEYEWWGIPGFVLAMLCGIGLAAAGLSLVVEPLAVKSRIAAFHQVRASVEAARERGDIEAAALALKIIEVNFWLAREQYWNGTCFDLWVPDEVDELEPIR